MTVVPEPSTAALMLLAMLGVLVLQAKGGRRAGCAWAATTAWPPTWETSIEPCYDMRWYFIF